MSADHKDQLARWTRAHEAKAELEGWNMFDYDCRGLLQIQRVDEAEVFTGDQAAIEHVKTRAGHGDDIARLALELHEYFDPIIYPEVTATPNM